MFVGEVSSKNVPEIVSESAVGGGGGCVGSCGKGGGGINVTVSLFDADKGVAVLYLNDGGSGGGGGTINTVSDCSGFNVAS